MMTHRNEEFEEPRNLARHSSRQEVQHITTHRTRQISPSGYSMDQHHSLPKSHFCSDNYGKLF